MTRTDRIPFLDLVTPHMQMKEELLSVFGCVLETAGFVGGPIVEEFERDFARFCGTPHCVGVGNGTDALRFALIAAGVGQGDIVVTVPNTFIATTEAISQAGARPEFVDVNECTYSMDPEKLREYLEVQCAVDSSTGKLIHKKLGRPVAALIPVHLYGQMADMDPILELASRYKLTVIEDACQAHGAEYFSKKENAWKKAGSMGHAAAFSFYPGKNLGACGEAGAVTTHDAALAQRVRMLRDHGSAKKYFHDTEGYNGRLDAIQAGILVIKLRSLGEWNRKRRQAAAHYESLAGKPGGKIVLPSEPAWAKAIYHLYVIQVPNRDQLIKHLAAAGIGTGIHYPIPLHLQKAYTSLGFQAGDFPVAERLAQRIISLPMFPHLDSDQIKVVVEKVLEFTSSDLSPK